MTENPPSNPVEGQLWFDTSDIEMSVFYIEPGKDYGQWVPIFSTTTLDQDVSLLQNQAIAESSSRLTGDNTLQSNINVLTNSLATQKTELVGTLNSLQAQITALPAVPDVSTLVTAQKQQSDFKNLQDQVSGNDGDIASLYNLVAVNKNDDNRIAALETSVANAINANTGITQVGGTLNGTLKIDKSDIGVPGLDYSTNDWDGRLAQKYQTYCNMSTNHYATFGTNNNLYEYAWDFDDNEDFCWTHGTNGKVASIDKTGIAATNFYIGTFGTNTDSGRTLTTTIDVGAHISAQKSALTALRTTAASATTLDELKTAISNALANL